MYEITKRYLKEDIWNRKNTIFTTIPRIAKVLMESKINLTKGSGTNGDMCRDVTQYWDLEGNFITEVDPCNVTELQMLYKKKHHFF